MPEPLSADLVLEGGGVKGTALVGAITALERRGYAPKRVAGTSAGAIVAAFTAAGATGRQLRGLLDDLDFKRISDRRGLGGLPGMFVPSALFSLSRAGGVFEGSYLRDWIHRQLKDVCGIEYFGQLRRSDSDATRPEQCYKLMVTATDITRGELIRLPWDYGNYGLAPDDQLVADAVRASMSIPLYFEPVRLRDAKSGQTSTLVDGGVLSNFPVDAFDRTDGAEPRWPTFGVKLAPVLPAGNASMVPFLGQLRGPLRPPLLELLEQLVTTIIVGRDQTYLRQPWVAARTVLVDTGKVGVIEFGLSAAERQHLFDNGVDAMDRFLAAWDFDDYRRRFRTAGTVQTTGGGPAT